MDSNLAKCFICDMTCVAKSKNLGSNIARTLTMPLISVLTKCLRTFVEVENEYFCCECTRKIEEYDNLARMSLQIETELFRQFQNKPFKSSFLDDELFVDQSEIRDFLDQGSKDKIKTSRPKTDDIDLSSKAVQQSTTKYTKPITIEEILNIPKAEEDDDDDEEEEEVEVEEVEEIEEEEEEYDKQIIEPKYSKNVKKSGHIEPIELNPSIAKLEQAEKSIKNIAENERNAEIAEFIERIKSKKKRGRKCKPKPPASSVRMKLKDWKTTSEGPLTCDICGRSYKTKGALGVHMVKHSDSNPHACKICKKVFTQRIGLLRHIPIHTGEHQHQCDICGKRFIHSASFNMHKKMHFNERSKKCEICGSEFRSSSHITRHMRSHTGERPFACPICGQRFTQRYNMKTHCNTHHREQNELKSLKCLICSETFVRREKLNEHLKLMHEAAIETSPTASNLD